MIFSISSEMNMLTWCSILPSNQQVLYWFGIGTRKMSMDANENFAEWNHKKIVVVGDPRLYKPHYHILPTATQSFVSLSGVNCIDKIISFILVEDQSFSYRCYLPWDPFRLIPPMSLAFNMGLKPACNRILIAIYTVTNGLMCKYFFFLQEKGKQWHVLHGNSHTPLYMWSTFWT